MVLLYFRIWMIFLHGTEAAGHKVVQAVLGGVEGSRGKGGQQGAEQLRSKKGAVKSRRMRQGPGAVVVRGGE